METPGQFNPPQQIDLKKLRIEMVQRLQAAMDNPMSQEEYEKFSEQPPQDLNKQKGLVVGHNLVEFQIMLDILTESDVVARTAARDWLAHENAHMNVAEQIGYNIIGYGMVFIDDGKNAKTMRIGALCLMNADIKAVNAKDLHERRIKVYNAPLDYGETLSDEDIRVVNQSRVWLKEITELEAAIGELKKKNLS
jgi:hypothetical protein